MGEGVHTIGTARRTDRSYQRDTDKGLNKQESYTINKVESKIRNRKTEKGYIIGEDGKIIGESYNSTRQSAAFRTSDMKKDSILTHNHPYVGNKGRRLYGTLAGRIGTPFSDTDIQNAVEYNLKEVRAVTPTYTYSMRRPKGGWGNQQEIMRALSSYRSKLNSQVNRYYESQRHSVNSYQRIHELSDRANVGIQNSALKELAKQFGWEFTRKKVK